MSVISRRELLQIAAGMAAAGATGAPAQADTQDAVVRPARVEPLVAERVPERFASLAFEAQQLDGLFAARMGTNVEGRLLQIDEQAFLAAFVHRDQAGEFDGAWVGEHAGKFLDAACNALRYRDQADLRGSADRVARALISSQEPDGYLGTYPAARRWRGWDVWVHKYNLIGLLSYYELSADPAALQACRRMGDLLCRTFGEAPGQQDIIAAGEHIGMAATSVLEPMCRLYRFTADPRHLEFCKYVVRAYDQPNGPRIVSTLLQSGSVYGTANGKAYEMLSNFNGLVDLYRLTGETRLLDAVLRGWDDIVGDQLYRTGSLSAREHFQPRGRLLTLPSSNVGETCATVTWLQLNWRLLRLTGEARFGQEIERTVYNHLLAAQDPHNGNISYYTSWVGPKECTNAILCCVSSGPRGISLIPQLVWGVEQGALVVNLYTAARARFQMEGVAVEVVSETDFPSDGHVRLTLSAERATPFTVRLRVPEWVNRFEVRVGERKLTGTPGRMLDVSRTWEGVSVLDIRVDMPVRVLPGGSGYPDYVLVERGPQVLALERALNPGVPYLERVGIADDAANSASLRSLPGPSGWRGRQVYEMDATVGLPADADAPHFKRQSVRLVPFADLADGTVWLTKATRVSRERPAVTTFARTSLSVVTLGLGRTADRPADSDIAEFVSDENPNTFCTLNPEDPSLATYLGAPPGKRGDPVWFSIRLSVPASISRVIYRHGAVSTNGGWFDTTQMVPRVEVATTPIPTSANEALPDDSKVNWRLAALVESYPRTNGSTPPPLADGQLFEVRLPQAMTIYGIRVVGRPGGSYATCAELSGYGDRV
jgi:DUF1680 family protein